MFGRKQGVPRWTFRIGPGTGIGGDLLEEVTRGAPQATAACLTWASSLWAERRMTLVSYAVLSSWPSSSKSKLTTRAEWGFTPCRQVDVENKVGFMKKLLKKASLLVLALTLLGLFTAFITGCGTVRGFGHDLGNVGNGIQRVAR